MPDTDPTPATPTYMIKPPAWEVPGGCLVSRSFKHPTGWLGLRRDHPFQGPEGVRWVVTGVLGGKWGDVSRHATEEEAAATAEALYYGMILEWLKEAG